MSAPDNVISLSRLAIKAQLETGLTGLNGQKFLVVDGERDGVSRDRNIACVFALPMVTNGNVNFANPQLVVRAWIRQPKPPKPSSPQDPSPVEQLLVDLPRALAGVQMPAGLNIYWLVQEVTPDWQDWGVQALLFGWTLNPATVIT